VPDNNHDPTGDSSVEKFLYNIISIYIAMNFFTTIHYFMNHRINLLLSTLILFVYGQAQQSCPGSGSINFQRWNNISGTSVSSLTSNPAYPNNPTTTGTRTLFEMPVNSGNNMGIRMNGYICPPVSGTYFFWIASDTNGELWLSTTSSPSNKLRIAYHAGSTNSRQWNKYNTQKSAPITLVAGELYYVEALMKESTGQDNLSVGWARPGQSTSGPSEVIPGTCLLTGIPVNDTESPSAPSNLSFTNLTQVSCTLNWTASTDNIAVAGYDVYRDGIKINSSIVTGTTFNVTGLNAGSTYSFTVIAKDAAGNSSNSSLPLTVTTYIAGTPNENFSVRTVISNQRMPHDLVYGPDNKIWYTERFAGKVSFVDPATGVKTTVLTLGAAMVRAGGQDGLMGLAIHPEFLNGKPFVYISYTYQSLSSTVRKTRIERYTYDPSLQLLGSPVTILQDIPGSNDHNSARLAIGPDLKLYYSVGDMGAGQFDNLGRTNNAQNLSIYEGKILRLHTEPEGGSWIPSDNPFTSGGVPTAVYSYGHRNPQGLVWGNVNGMPLLYSSEHGPFSDDELNIIESGRNYGWPNVIGFCDGNYNNRMTGGYTIVNEQNNCASLNAREPIRSLFPVTNPPSSGDNMLWPSTAPSGIDFYSMDVIPGWQNSILVANLKKGTITRFKLSVNGMNIISDTLHYFRGMGRFRDIVVSSDGLKLYVACDSSGSTSGPTGNVTSTPANPGSILEFTFQPSGGKAWEQLIVAKEHPSLNTTRIEAYPNPASDYFVVYNYSPNPHALITMTDMNGRTIKRLNARSTATRILCRNMAPGIYIMQVTDASGLKIGTSKIVIQ
jgi:PQQ-dependent dehydrogenase (s-GDH family)